jgi:HEAT repeat protein
MYTINNQQLPKVVDKMHTLTTLPVAVEVQPDTALDRWLGDLSPDTPWGDRQLAAQKLGDLGCPEAVSGLLTALPTDPFWMVRCAMIQALERIGDPVAVPTLQTVASRDGFQIVRSYAAKAIERLS